MAKVHDADSAMSQIDRNEETLADSIPVDSAFAGSFETHLTVSAADHAAVDRLRAWGARHGLKCVHIILCRGAQVSQPMLTRRARGSLREQLLAASDLRMRLAAEGFPVTRIKVEATLESEGVPQSDEEAARRPAEQYFEHHLKLLLAPEADHEALAYTAEQHASHLSRNALRQRADGRQERFVTQRCRAVGRAEARRRLEALRDAIAPVAEQVLDVEEEYVVYDSNSAVDAGWLDRNA